MANNHSRGTLQGYRRFSCQCCAGRSSMLEVLFSDLSFRVLARETIRRRAEALDEARERIAGFLAVGLVVTVPLYYVVSGSGLSLPDVSLVEPSEAAEPSAGPHAFEAPPVNAAAVLNRLQADHLGAADLSALQTQLKVKGFNPGPIDGKEGKRTLAALNRYRQSLHLPHVQAINRDTVADLLDR